ncbi:hypothetical protein FS837_003029, partial [Tulasnella sp. UAMH 9824]
DDASDWVEESTFTNLTAAFTPVSKAGPKAPAPTTQARQLGGSSKIQTPASAISVEDLLRSDDGDDGAGYKDEEPQKATPRTPKKVGKGSIEPLGDFIAENWEMSDKKKR